MNQIMLSYSTFGLTDLDFLDALEAVDRAGYDGVEISFHRDQFNPFDIDDDDLGRVRDKLAGLRVKPACVATASHFFDPFRPHDPSLMATERAARKRRVALIRRGIHVARQLGVNLVTFGSGFLRPGHFAHPAPDPTTLLVDSIHECLDELHDDEDITLLIEPEPGMHIETLAQGRDLIERVGSPRFRLHVDVCHSYCAEEDYIADLERAAPLTRYLHVSDARPGYNLKVVEDCEGLSVDLDRASWLVHFPDTADFLLLDRKHPIHFREEKPAASRVRRIDALLEGAGIGAALQSVEYRDLYAGSSPLDDEIFTWMISVPGLSFDVLERTRPVVMYLRGVRHRQLVSDMVANTITGIAHFHEIPGEGTLDLEASFRALTRGGFSGYGSVELYHHVASWQKALDDSYRHLSRLTPWVRAASFPDNG